MKKIFYFYLTACLLFMSASCDSPQKILDSSLDGVTNDANTSDSKEDENKIDSDEGETHDGSAADTGNTTADTGDTNTDTGDTNADTGDTASDVCIPNPCTDIVNSTGKCVNEAAGYSCECRANYTWNSETLDCELANCTVDMDCGPGKICTKNSQCADGCMTDEDCINHIGTYCNKKLARCVNPYASNRACSEMNCRQGCCFAEKGLTGLRCSDTQNVLTCGHCDQGEVYSPEDSKCISSACSTTTDNCPALNQNSYNQPAKCYHCAEGEYICKANSSTSGCSSGMVINAKTCIPSGGECSAATDCCSGMPCVNGFCY